MAYRPDSMIDHGLLVLELLSQLTASPGSSPTEGVSTHWDSWTPQDSRPRRNPIHPHPPAMSRFPVLLLFLCTFVLLTWPECSTRVCQWDDQPPCRSCTSSRCVWRGTCRPSCSQCGTLRLGQGCNIHRLSGLKPSKLYISGIIE